MTPEVAQLLGLLSSHSVIALIAGFEVGVDPLVALVVDNVKSVVPFVGVHLVGGTSSHASRSSSLDAHSLGLSRLLVQLNLSSLSLLPA